MMLDLLELELQVVSNPVWVLGTELGLSEEQRVLLTAEPSRARFFVSNNASSN